MATDAELMLMAMRSYTRLLPNTAPIPQGWNPIPVESPNANGFSAAAFRNPNTGEVVIAYAGTDADTFGTIATDFLNGNIPAAVEQVQFPPSPRRNRRKL